MSKTYSRLATCLGIVFACVAADAQTFAVASIRPSAEPVPFENDGKTETSPGNLRMRDVTAATCIKWAYGVQNSQISGPDWLQSERFDIIAKADGLAGDDQMRTMMRSLLADRFHLTFHRQPKDLSGYALTVGKSGHKLKVSAADTVSNRQNSAMGTIARAISMREFADFLSGPLATPVVDETGLTARYDFAIDFTPYLQAESEAGRKPDVVGIVLAALQGDLGIKLESRKVNVEILVIDRVERPTEN